MATIPTHDITAPIRYISVDDPAWTVDDGDGDKQSRWVYEMADLEGDILEAHPMRKYYRGLTRYDLAAPGLVGDEERTPESYLSGTPTTYKLRRLKVAEMTQCRDLPPAAQAMLAFRLCCKGIEGGPSEMSYNPPKNTAAKEVHVEEVAAHLGMEVIYEVGKAVLRSSAPATYAEKKHSD